jgi:hypothetical protein
VTPPHHPRPIHRWKSLWLGLFVLIFLGWGWMRSLERRDTIEWITTISGTTVGQQEGTVWIYHGGVPAFYSKGLHADSIELDYEPLWFPPALDAAAFPGHFHLTIAHWLLGLCLLVPWSAFLLWRIRRQRRPIALTRQGRL